MVKGNGSGTSGRGKNGSKTVSTRSQQQSDKIIKAAGRLFWQKGYLGTSIDEVARVAGVNKATIYYYFKNKNQILFEIASRGMQELFNLVRPVAEADLPAEEKLELLIINHLKWQTSHPGFAGIVQTERKNMEPKLMRAYTDMRDEYEAIFLKVIGEILARNGHSNGNTKIATLFTLGLVNSVMHWYKPNGKLTSEDIATEALDFVSRALKPLGRN